MFADGYKEKIWNDFCAGYSGAQQTLPQITAFCNVVRDSSNFLSARYIPEVNLPTKLGLVTAYTISDAVKGYYLDSAINSFLYAGPAGIIAGFLGNDPYKVGNLMKFTTSLLFFKHISDIIRGKEYFVVNLDNTYIDHIRSPVPPWIILFPIYTIISNAYEYVTAEAEITEENTQIAGDELYQVSD